MPKAPGWFVPIAALALLWNLIGCSAWIMDVMLSSSDIAAMDAAQQAMYSARPDWSLAATGVAVWCGALGCLGLVLRRSWSLALLALSLAGLLLQDFALAQVIQKVGSPGSAVYGMQSAILVIAVALLWLAWTARKRGWIS